ncbi:MAG: DUF3990 domain-containing protein [Selenomonas sp.]|nr:DUF3990 domain-containing protein [Selenomonas sp.]
MKLFHGTDIFSADKILNEGISLSHGRPFLDFGQGFYTTPHLAQAIDWAEGTISPCVLSMELDESNLKIKGFDTPSREWAEFVIKNRFGLIPPTEFDCIYGPMADSGVSRLYARYQAHRLTMEAAINKIRANTNGWQWVVLSNNAVKHISNIRKVVL